ncbi:competence protein ComGF [Alkalibacillus flavidus]|uniref:Competence protein ComGF n=1 Tax=Alkalibacillus flavidus TaxID=546021 RepID=A0ABV2KXI3_9BACI
MKPIAIVTIRNQLTNTNGYTLIHALIALTIIIVVLPLTSPILQSAASLTSIYNPNQLEYRQFDFFVSFELNRSQSVHIEPEAIHFTRFDGRVITFERYQDLIRRRTNDDGHSIMMFNVSNFQINRVDDHAFKISFRRRGETVEQVFTHDLITFNQE